MKVDALETFLDIGSELAFESVVEVFIVRQSTVLVELAEELVELEGRVIEDELVPVVALGQGTVLALEVGDDFLEVPGEGQDVGVLLLRELSVNAEALISLVKLNGRVNGLLDFELAEGAEGLDLESGGQEKGEGASGGGE